MIERLKKLECSFCYKIEDEVRYLFRAWESVCICDECVKLCQDVMDEREKEEELIEQEALRRLKKYQEDGASIPVNPENL